MKPNLSVLGLLLMALFSWPSTNAQPTYIQPTSTVPAWQHASTQSLYSISVKLIDETTLLDYVDAAGASAYNWLQDTKNFEVNPGETIKIAVRSGIWTWDIHLGFDWNGDGTFEDVRRGFANTGAPVSKENSSWGAHAAPYNTGAWRQKEMAALGHRGVLYKEFTVVVPNDAQLGEFRMRVLCDGDGYNSGGVPPFNMSGSVGYAGSITDFGIHVVQPGTRSPKASLPEGKYKEDQTVSLVSATQGAKIYYTLDGSEPSDTNGELYDSAKPVEVVGAELENSVVTLKAIAYSEEYGASSVSTFIYKIMKSWSEPGGYVHPTEERYITEAVTTGAMNDLAFNQSSVPTVAYIDTQSPITALANSSFDLTVKSTYNTKWCHAIVFVDWNQNRSFDDPGEQVEFIGQENKGVDEVTDFTRTIEVPATAKAGETRMRIQFTDAWHKNTVPGHTHSGDDDMYKGGIYDFVLNIVKEYGIEIDGVPLTSANADSLTFDDAEGYVRCDGDTLFLNNFKYASAKDRNNGLIYIYADKDIVVKLEGDNEISTSVDDKTGIYAACSKLTIEGPGSLVVTTPSDAALFTYKTCDTLMFKGNCTFEANGKFGLLGSTPVKGQNLVVDSCTVRAKGWLSSIENYKNVTLTNVQIVTPQDVDYSDGIFKVEGAQVTQQIVIMPTVPTGIAGVVVPEPADAGIYNLKGMKMTGTMESLPKGIYIINGKKVVK